MILPCLTFANSWLVGNFSRERMFVHCPWSLREKRVAFLASRAGHVSAISSSCTPSIPVTESGLNAFGSSRTWDHHSEYHTLEILTLRTGFIVVAEPAREDALIHFHSGPQEGEGSGLAQHFFSSSHGLTTARDRT